MVVLKRVSVESTELSAFENVDASTLAAASSTAKRILDLIERVPRGWPIGLEHHIFKIDLPDIPAGTTAGYLKQLGVIMHPQQGLSGYRRRPPSEYGVISLFKRLDDGNLRPSDLAKAVELMGGSPRWRRLTATTQPFLSGHYTEFLSAKRAIPVLRRVVMDVSNRAPIDYSIIRAIRAYFLTTLSHPFMDGNGRAGRALFQCVLKVDLGLSVPLFPLGPYFERYKLALLETLYYLQIEGNAKPLIYLIMDFIQMQCDILREKIS